VRLSVKPEAAFALPAQVQSCSADQQSLINSAIQQAEILSMEAKRDLDSLTTAQSRINSPRLTKWFGEYDDNRFNKISNVHTQIAAALSSEQLTISDNLLFLTRSELRTMQKPMSILPRIRPM